MEKFQLRISITEEQVAALEEMSKEMFGEINLASMGRVIIQEKINQTEQMRIIDSLPQDNVRIVNENSEH